MYRIRNSELCRWILRLDEPTEGIVDNLDEAKAAFRAAWTRACSPLSEEADEKCLGSLKMMTNSNFACRITGRSAGFSPLRTHPA
jgi:hypothetical protein